MLVLKTGREGELHIFSSQKYCGHSTWMEPSFLVWGMCLRRAGCGAHTHRGHRPGRAASSRPRPWGRRGLGGRAGSSLVILVTGDGGRRPWPPASAGVSLGSPARGHGPPSGRSGRRGGWRSVLGDAAGGDRRAAGGRAWAQGRAQWARCFRFLCFFSFFLLGHLGQNHCISSGGAAVIPTQGQWYQSSQPSQPIMGLPSSGLLHPGQIQIWFPHSSRIT